MYISVYRIMLNVQQMYNKYNLKELHRAALTQVLQFINMCFHAKGRGNLPSLWSGDFSCVLVVGRSEVQWCYASY